MRLQEHVCVGEAVARALQAGQPVVALETAVVSHGLPPPHNLEALSQMEQEIGAVGAIAAVCLVHRGLLWIGADGSQVTALARDPSPEKASVRDLGFALGGGLTAGLTVSATLFAARLAGIRVLATGGIGGVHFGSSGDVSADLYQMSRTPVITVCSGVKSVLDIPRTLEYLETLGVPVFSFRTPEFPAFYLRSSGIQTPALDSPRSIAQVAQAQWNAGYEAGIVIGNPIPSADAVRPADWEGWMRRAEDSAMRAGVQGKEVTPHLLSRVAVYSRGQTVAANVSLLRRNAALAAEIAGALAA